MTVSPNRRKPNRYFRLSPEDANPRCEDSVGFLKGVKADLGGPMTIIWDRSRIHGRSSLVKAYLAGIRRS